MGGEHLPEHLADTRHVTVVLRLVATAAGRLVHGELVDPDGASLAKFLDWENLIELLQRRLGLAAPAQDDGPAIAQHLEAAQQTDRDSLD